MLHKNVLVVTPQTEKASAEGAKSNSRNDDSPVSVNSKQKKLGKNGRKKLQQRAALIENWSRSNESSKTDCDVLEESPVGKESNAIDLVYPNGNINYTMLDNCQYAHQKNEDYRISYKCCLGSYNCPSRVADSKVGQDSHGIHQSNRPKIPFLQRIQVVGSTIQQS
jgi:hypothetical protein